MCTNAGGGGGGGSLAALKNQLEGNKIDLDYAKMKANEWGNLPYGGTRRSRELFSQWNDEVKRLQQERIEIERKIERKTRKNTR